MKTLIIYDSVYGNTEKVARAMVEAIGKQVTIEPISKVKHSDMFNADLVIFGSPVHGGRPTPAVDQFLKSMPARALQGRRVAAFDTRFAPEDHGVALNILMRIIRFAAQRMANDLKRKGGLLVAPPEGFIVEDKEGPMKKGELNRAGEWARALVLTQAKQP